MPRQCSVCNRAEVLMAVNARLLAGESQTELAREFQFSVDALARHAKRHLRHDDKEVTQDSSLALMQKALRHAEALVDTCSATGDHRGLDSALAKLVAITETIEKLQSKASAGFESLSLREKVRYIKSDEELYRLILDDCVHQYPDLVVRGTDSELSRGLHMPN